MILMLCFTSLDSVVLLSMSLPAAAAAAVEVAMSLRCETSNGDDGFDDYDDDEKK